MMALTTTHLLPSAAVFFCSSSIATFTLPTDEVILHILCPVMVVIPTVTAVLQWYTLCCHSVVVMLTVWCYGVARLHIQYPMLFKLTNNRANRVTHCGVLEFVADEGRVYLPYWVIMPELFRRNNNSSNAELMQNHHIGDTELGAAVNQAASNTIAKYDELASMHISYPVFIETGRYL